MDNITHTLIGITLGHVCTLRRTQHRRAAIWTALVASNLPDLDILLPQAISDGKIGYLLQHRGYSHALIFAIPLGLLAGLLIAKLARVELRAWPQLLGVGALAAVLHIAADSWNEYGIHPFFPFGNRWFYGDFIFILEPLLWFSMIPLAILGSKSRLAKGFWSIAVVLILLSAWSGQFMEWKVALALTLFGAIVTAAQRRWATPAPALIASGFVLLVFFGASRVARDEIREYLANQAPEEFLLQLVTAPAPSNPFCWRAVVATRAPGEVYRARIGVLSIAPETFDPVRCLPRAVRPGTAPLVPVDLPSTPGLHWLGQFQAKWAELEALRARSCTFAAFLQFARVPFWRSEGEATIAGDLRYDRESGLGFAELEWTGAGSCPKSRVPWLPPLTQSFERNP